MEALPDIVAVMVPVSVEGAYSYRVPYGMSVVRGSIVAVTLVGRLTLGVVWGTPKDNFAHNRLKDIEHVYDCPPKDVPVAPPASGDPYPGDPNTTTPEAEVAPAPVPDYGT